MIRALIVILLVGALGFWYWTTTPQYAVVQIHDSIKNHDLQTFQKYADMDSVAGKMVDDLLTRPVQAALGPGIVGQLLGFGLGTFIKPLLVASMKEEIKDYIMGDTDSPSSFMDNGTRLVSTHSFRGIPGQLGFGGKIYKGMEYVRTEGKICRVGLKLHNEKYNTDLVLELKLSNSDGTWRLISLSNLQEFMGKILDLQAHGERQTESMLVVPRLKRA